MTQETARRSKRARARQGRGQLGQTGHNLLRILVASYFIGVAAGLIEGTQAAALAAPFLPQPAAEALGAAVVFALAYMVMTGIWLRPAALLLGLVTFWSSYLQHFAAADAAAGIGAFWRDLTLIGALMLTYAGFGPRARRRSALFRRRLVARRLKASRAVQPRRVRPSSAHCRDPRPRPAGLTAPAARQRDPSPRPGPIPPAIASPENIFRDEIESARIH